MRSIVLAQVISRGHAFVMDQNSNTAMSIIFMITGMAIVGIIDNFMKFIAIEISLWQFHFLRSLIAVPVIVIFALLVGWDLKPKRLWPVLGRNIFLSGAMFIYFGCLGFFPIAAVAAGLFTAPVLVLAIDAIWSRRRIGPVRIITALLGFIGTILVLKPDVGGFSWVNLIPVLAGLMYAFGNVATRKWCEGESAVALLWSYKFLMLIFGGLGVIYLYFDPGNPTNYLSRGWVWPSLQVWFWLWVQAVFSLIGIGFIMKAYLIGEVTYVSIFEYSMLIFATLTAWLLFGDKVGPLGILGIGLIIVTGAVVSIRSKEP
ncbi:MAG: DMT family transporter [Planktomarina sp.]|jgi:drug/metabolite transporter (DMT)-like permease|nr:DMT family transporter [Planktomarina sp.]MDT2033295.1 DMT family transporter [Planktomarina sp.]MDT2039769.1 DMT family transporter [Planktomarina sp.]MDT2049608.1 DMT family transporter [Planktomarina sp.]|tara:strand:+ start:1781 stop:2728 length:948 start_codon:yes stop_codon:yes gene_type:complete